MAATRILGVIPARLASERLPGKPLQLLAGEPLVLHVWRAVHRFRIFDRVVVATDAAEVATVCRRAGVAVELTAPGHASGTERVAEVAARSSFLGFHVVVNVQGDEPFVAADAVRTAASLVEEGWDVGTVATPLRTSEALRDPAVVKVVRGTDGAALYFSRAPIPHRRAGDPDPGLLASPRYLRHVGVYAYAPEALRRWVALPVDPLEELERLEQLRPLAAGLRIGVGIVPRAEPGIDTPADLAWAEERLVTTRERHESGGAAEA